MEIVNNTFYFETNLDGSCLDKLKQGVWKLDIFSDNPGIEDETSDIFYKDMTTEDGTERSFTTEDGTKRIFKNKVRCTLYDKSIVEAHIIHLNAAKGWFCVTFDTFWDRLENNNL